ncbi:ABC transporter permease subunit [Actinoplanes couchii]|uniref:ABC transporter permease n=1 Tax=Actinoplanes couchii TaxID=403638 RepID=A0ABQ3XLR4_9ACTN|nr:ABC transporter permease subunit [Actinoplanes couchii]MDR6319335.1 ABC-2 type transport system permease protein [Actinoplanes couchii]GID59455.1 ABC transporter permease [Actinoplanes couchii]
MMRHVLASEWSKLWSVRSTGWSLLATVLTVVGVAVISGRSLLTYTAPGDVTAADVVGVATEGIVFGQLAICVLGAMAVTAEYGTGLIRSSLAAVPSRGLLLTAKALVVAAVALVTGTVTGLLAFLVARPMIGAPASGVGLTDPSVLRAVTGSGLYLAVLAVFALAVGTILRHSAATVTTLILGVMILPGVVAQFGDVGRAVSRWWPSHAGFQLLQVDRLAGQLAPWPGFLAFTATTAALLAVAAVLLTRRDA